MKKIILVVGLPGSGKTNIADHIKKKFNAAVFLSGDVIRDEIKRRGLKYTPENDAKIAHWFNTKKREDLLVKRLWAKIKRSRKRIIVIDGFRSPENLKYLEKISKTKPVVIVISSSFEMRVKRLLRRSRFGREESRKYIQSRDMLEKNHGIMKLMGKADYSINNSRLSRRQTNSRISKIIKEIITN